MSTRKGIKDRLREIRETDLHLVLLSLFEALDYKDVKVTHGTTEFGKDLVFYEEDKFGEKIWYACVVKKGDVNQSVLFDISRQITEAFRKPFDHHQFGKVKITKIFVIASGIYKDNAKALITEEIKNGENVIKYFENSDISLLLDKHELNYLLDDNCAEDPAQAKYKAYVLTNLLDNNGLKFLEADFGIPVDAIDDFRINVRAKSKALFDERKNYVEEKELSLSYKLLPEISEILSSKKPFLLHGIATSGKTTILKKLGKDFLKSNKNGILFYFDLNKITKGEKIDIKNEIEASYLKISNTKFDWNQKIPLLILLDGLDEVSDDKMKELIVEDMLVLKALTSLQIIVTSRTIDFLVTSDYIDGNFEKFELLALNYNEMIQIGNKILDDPSQAKKFVHLVQNSELLNSFPKTPLTTILLAILLKEEKIDIKELPKNISELYSKFVDLFLNKWDKGKGISEQYQLAEKEFVLKRLAEELQKGNQISFTEIEILEHLDIISQERPIDILKDPRQFLENICERSSILIKNKADGTYRFFHLTIQEFLAANILTTKDEDLLVENFLNDWWLNTNIFYAGKRANESSVLERISSLEVYPLSYDDRMKYIINASKVVKAVHLWDHESRKKLILTMLKMFEDLILDVTSMFIVSEIITLKNKTLLDIILWARAFFVEFLDSSQFSDAFKSIWRDITLSPANYNDILRYCIAYNLSLKEHDAKYLEEFIQSDSTLNPRWFKIVYVDINVKHLKPSNKKLVMKFKNKASEHKKYIQRQFQDRLNIHYLSITGMKPLDTNEDS